jgi:hypothetical protein
MLIFRIVLAAGIVLTAVLVVNQILARRAGRLDLTGRQMVIRISSGVTLILIFAVVLTGNILGIVFTTGSQHLAKNPRLLTVTIAYASLIAGLSCLLLFLALLDIHEVAQMHRQARIDARAGLRRKDGRDQ